MRPITLPTVGTALRSDAERTAVLASRHDFEELSSRKILARLRAAEPELAAVADDALLHQWFTAYDDAAARLANRSVNRLREPLAP